jgi:hypothetical protein
MDSTILNGNVWGDDAANLAHMPDPSSPANLVEGELGLLSHAILASSMMLDMIVQLGRGLSAMSQNAAPTDIRTGSVFHSTDTPAEVRGLASEEPRGDPLEVQNRADARGGQPDRGSQAIMSPLTFEHRPSPSAEPQRLGIASAQLQIAHTKAPGRGTASLTPASMAAGTDDLLFFPISSPEAQPSLVLPGDQYPLQRVEMPAPPRMRVPAAAAAHPPRERAQSGHRATRLLAGASSRFASPHMTPAAPLLGETGMAETPDPQSMVNIDDNNATERGYVRSQPETSEPPQSGTEPRYGTLIFDGARLGRWMIDHLERKASRAVATTTGVDPRMTLHT